MAACPICQDESGALKEVPLSLSVSQVDDAFLEVLAHLSGLPLFYSSALVESRASTLSAARESDRETPTERTQEADKEREKAPRGGPSRRRDFPAYAAERDDSSLSSGPLEDKTSGKAKDIATELVSQRSSSSSLSSVFPSPGHESYTPSRAVSSQQRGCSQIDGRHLRSFPWVTFSPSPSPARVGQRLWQSLQFLRGSISPAAPRPSSTSHTGKRAAFRLHAHGENRKSPLSVSSPPVGQQPVGPLQLEPERSPVLPSVCGGFRSFAASLERPLSPERTPSVHSTTSMGTKALAPSPVLSRRQARRERKRRAAEEAKRLACSSPCPSASLVSAQHGTRDPTRGDSETQETTTCSQKFALSRVEQPVDYLFKQRVGRDEERGEGRQGKQTVLLIQENEGGAERAMVGEEKREARDGAETRWGNARAGHQDGDSELEIRLFVESRGSAKLVDVSLKQRLKEEEIYAALPPLQLLLRRGLSLLEIVNYTPRECRVPQRGPSQEGSERSERREEEICGQQGHRCRNESGHGHRKDKRPRLDVEQHVDAGDGSRAENSGERKKRRQGKDVEETGSDEVTWGSGLDDELGKKELAKESEGTSHAAATPEGSLSQECASSASGRNSASPTCPADWAPVSSFASVSPSPSSLSASCVPSTRKRTEQHLVRMGLPKFFDFHLPLFSAFLLCMHRHIRSLPLQPHRVYPALRSQTETHGQGEKAGQGDSTVTTPVSVLEDLSENGEDQLTRNGEGSESFEDLEGNVLSRDEVRRCHRKERIFLESEEKRLHASLRRAAEAIAMTPADTFSLVQHLRQGQVENREEGVEKFRRGERCTGPCCARDGSSSPLCTQVPSPLSLNPNGGRPSRLQLPPTLRAETLQPALLTAAHTAVLSTRQLASRVHAAFALAEEMRFLEDSRHTDEGQGRDEQEIPIALRASKGRTRGGNAAVKSTSLASASLVNEGPWSSSSFSASSLETCSSSRSVSPRSLPFGVEVFALEKVNGENAQISFSAALDAWCICSKNVSLLVPSEAFSEETELKEGHRETKHPSREDWPTGKRKADAVGEGRGAEHNRRMNNEDNEARGIFSSHSVGETKRDDARAEDHILDRKELRYQHAVKVARAWKRLLSGRSEHQVESLKRFLSNHTIVGEFVGCKKKQHFLPYWEPPYAKLFLSPGSSSSSSTSSFPYLIFYAAVPHDGFQVCLPPHAALTLLREKYQLPTARIFSSFSATSLLPFLEQLQSVVDETFCSDMHVGGVGEGVVLYFTGPCHVSASSLSPSASADASPSSCASGEHSGDTPSRPGPDALLSSSSSLPSSSPPSSSSSSSALPASLPSSPPCVFPLVLGLAKVKSLGYLLRRRIREKLRHSISSFSLLPLAPHLLALSASPAFSFFSSLALHHPVASAPSSLLPHLLENRQQLSCRQRRKLRARLATSLLASEPNPEVGLSERAQESPFSPLQSAQGSESVFKGERQACGDRKQIRWGDGNSESAPETREEGDINERLRAALDRIQLIAWSQLERDQNEQQEVGQGEPVEDRERHTFSQTSAKSKPNFSETTHVPGWAEKLLTAKTEAAAGLRVDAACAALTTDSHMWTCSFSSFSDSEEYYSSLGVLAERSECWLIEFVQEAIGHLPQQPAFNPAVSRLLSLVSSPGSRSSAANRGGVSSLRRALHAAGSEDVKGDGEKRASEGLCRSTEKAHEVRAKGEVPGSSRGKRTPATEERARTKAPEDVSGRQMEEGEATSKIAKARRRNETEDRGKQGEKETQVGGAKEGNVDSKDRNSGLRNHSDVAVDIILSLTRKYEDALLYASSLASAAVLASALDLPSSPSSASSSCVGAGDLKHRNNGKKRLFDRDGSSLLSFLEERINAERLRTIVERLEAFVDLRFLNFMDEASAFRLSLEKERRHLQETASIDGQGRTRQDREKELTETICVAKEETEEGPSEPIVTPPCAGSYGAGESEKNGAAKQTPCMLSMSPTPVSRCSRGNACENKGTECLSASLCHSSSPSTSPSLAISPLPSCSPLGVPSTPVVFPVPSQAASSPPVVCLVVPPLALSFSVYRFLNAFAGSQGFRLVLRHCLFYPCEGLRNCARQRKSGSDAASASSLCRSPLLSSSDLSSCAACTSSPACSSPSQWPSSSAAVTVVWGYGSPASREDEMDRHAAVSLKNLGRLCLLACPQSSGSREEDMDGIAEFSSNERKTSARTGSTAAGAQSGKAGAALDRTAIAERTRDGQPKNRWVTAALNFCRVVEEDGDEEGKKNKTEGGNEDEREKEKEGSTRGKRGAGRSQKDAEVNGEEGSPSCRGVASDALGQIGVAPKFFSSHADKVQARKLETEDELKKGENTLAETLRHVVVTNATVRFLELFPSCLTPERFLSHAFMLLRLWRYFPTELRKHVDGTVDPQAADSSPWILPHSLRKCGSGDASDRERGDWAGVPFCSCESISYDSCFNSPPCPSAAGASSHCPTSPLLPHCVVGSAERKEETVEGADDPGVPVTSTRSACRGICLQSDSSKSSRCLLSDRTLAGTRKNQLFFIADSMPQNPTGFSKMQSVNSSLSKSQPKFEGVNERGVELSELEGEEPTVEGLRQFVHIVEAFKGKVDEASWPGRPLQSPEGCSREHVRNQSLRPRRQSATRQGTGKHTVSTGDDPGSQATSTSGRMCSEGIPGSQNGTRREKGGIAQGPEHPAAFPGRERGEKKSFSFATRPDEHPKSARVKSQAETPPLALITCVLPVGFPGCGKSTALMHFVHEAVNNCVARREEEWKRRRLRECVREGDEETGQTGAKNEMEDLQDGRQGQRACGERRTEHRHLADVDATAEEIAITIWNASPLRPDLPLCSSHASTVLPCPQRSAQSTSSDLLRHAAAATSGEPGTEGRHPEARIRSGKDSKPRQEASDVCLAIAGGSAFGGVDILFFVSSDEATGAALRRRGVRGCVPTSRSFQKAVSALEASPGILTHPRLCEEEMSASSQVACREANANATGERTPSAESPNEHHVSRVRHRPQPRGEAVEADLAEGKCDGGGETGQTEEEQDIPENVFRPAAREGAANLAASVDAFFAQLEQRLMAYFHKQEKVGDDEAEELEGEEGNEGSGVVPSGVSTFHENTRKGDAQLVQKDGNSNSKGHWSENGTRKPLRVLVLIDKNFPVDSVPKQTAILQRHCAALNRKLNQACVRAIHRSVSGQPDSPDYVSFCPSLISTTSGASQDRHSDGSRTLKPLIRAAVCLMTLPPDARQDGSLRTKFLCPLSSTSPCSVASLSFSSSPWAFPWSLPTLCCCLRRVLSRTDHPTLRSRVKRNCGDSCFQASPWPVSEQSTSAQSVDLGESHGQFFSAPPVSAPGGTRPVGSCAVVNVFLSFVAMYRHQSLDPADLQKISGVDAVLPCHSVWLPPLKERPASRDRGLRAQDSEATQEESEARGVAHVTEYYGKSPRREGRESSEACPKRTVGDAFLPPSVEDECYLLIATALQNLRPFSDNIFNVPIYERLVSLLVLSAERDESAENEKHGESGRQKPSSFGSGPATPASSRDAAGELSSQLEATFERLRGNSWFGSTFTVFDLDCRRQAFEGRRQREGCGSQRPQQERHRDQNRTRDYQRPTDVSHMHSGDAGPHRCSRVAPGGPSGVQANVSEDRRQLLRVGPEFADHVEHQILREQVQDVSGPPISVQMFHERGAGESGGDVDGPTGEEPASGHTRETTGADFVLSTHRVGIVEKSKSKLAEPRMRQASTSLCAVGIAESQGSAEPVRAAVGSSASRLEEALAHWEGGDEQKKQDPSRVIEVRLPVYFCVDVDRHASLLFALVSSSLDSLQANSPSEGFFAAARRFSQLVQTSLRNVTRLHVTSFYLGGGDVRTTQREVEVLEAQARQREEDARRRTRSWFSTRMRKESVAGNAGRSPSVTRGQAGSLCPGGTYRSSGSGVRSFSDYSARDAELLAAFVASRRIIGQAFKVEVTHLVFFGEGLVAAGVRPLCSLVLLDNEFDGASRRSGAVSRTASVGANHLQRDASSLDQQRRGPSADLGQRTTSSRPVASGAGVQYPSREASLFHLTRDTRKLLVCRTSDSRREKVDTSSSTTTANTDRHPHCEGKSDTTSSLCFGEKRYPHISIMLARHLKPQFSNVVMAAAANAQRQAQTQGLLLTDTPPIFNTGDRDRGSKMSSATASSQSLFSEVNEHSSENAGQWILFKDLFVAGRRDAALVLCLPPSSVILEGPFLARYN
ncbi:UNVERIFIED_CONTAM: hypothetical protein HHA_283550 [Hammondia hammondi]|eukprot:XP_008888065.1 hypothetical protein HHA_283550 [Hammondia hammondi]